MKTAIRITPCMDPTIQRRGRLLFAAENDPPTPERENQEKRGIPRLDSNRL